MSETVGDAIDRLQYFLELRKEQRRRTMGAIAKAWRVLRDAGVLYSTGEGRIRTVKPTCLKILIVDDDEQIRQTLADILYEEGFLPLQSGNGVEALRELEAYRYDPPALIVLDLMMPVMSGYQFREKQLEDADFAKIPVLVISAYQRNLHKIPEGVEYLDKPLSLDSLLPIVTRLAVKPKSEP